MYDSADVGFDMSEIPSDVSGIEVSPENCCACCLSCRMCGSGDEASNCLTSARGSSASSSSGIALMRPSMICQDAFCVPSGFLKIDSSAPSSHISGKL